MRRVRAVDGLTSFLIESSSCLRNHAVGTDVRGCGGGGGAKTGARRTCDHSPLAVRFPVCVRKRGAPERSGVGINRKVQRHQNATNRWFLVQKRGAAGRVRHAPGLYMYKVVGDLEGLKGRCVARQRGRGVCAGGPVCPGGGS